jgi:hypothetical protein
MRLLPSWLRRQRRRPRLDEVIAQVDPLLVDLNKTIEALSRQYAPPPRNGSRLPARRWDRP